MRTDGIAGPCVMPAVLMPTLARRIMFFLNVISRTVDQGAVPSWLADFMTIAAPSCAAVQIFSKTLPSTSTRWAFFNSKRFLTVHELPFQDSGLKK